MDDARLIQAILEQVMLLAWGR